MTGEWCEHSAGLRQNKSLIIIAHDNYLMNKIFPDGQNCIKWAKHRGYIDIGG